MFKCWLGFFGGFFGGGFEGEFYGNFLVFESFEVVFGVDCFVVGLGFEGDRC